MKFTFLGTGAAFGYPQPFCKCEHCEKARKAGGKNIRKRSAALINDDLLIDIGPDVVSSSQAHGVSLLNVQHCLLTHPHSDHLDLYHLLSRSISEGLESAPPLDVLASADTLKHANETLLKDLPGFSLLSPKAEKDLHMKLYYLEAFQPVKVGPYQVIPFPADHAPGLGAMLYAVMHKSRAVFYGTDTESLSEEIWRAFHELQLSFDLVVLDHTNGPNEPGFGHLNSQLVSEYTRRMRSEGVLKESGEVYITHISHRGNPIHDELAEISKQNGYKSAYDGLVVDL